jgi:hypothetical protein
MDGILIGAAGVVAGSRMVEGGGLLIPYHGLGCVEGHVMFVLRELSPLASITPPKAVNVLLVKAELIAPQKLVPVPAKTLASKNAGEFLHGEQCPNES